MDHRVRESATTNASQLDIYGIAHCDACSAQVAAQLNAFDACVMARIQNTHIRAGSLVHCSGVSRIDTARVKAGDEDGLNELQRRRVALAHLVVEAACGCNTHPHFGLRPRRVREQDSRLILWREGRRDSHRVTNCSGVSLVVMSKGVLIWSVDVPCLPKR